MTENGGIFQLQDAMTTKFKAKYGKQEKYITFRSDVTKELYYDVTRGGKVQGPTEFVTTKTQQTKQGILMKKSMMKLVTDKMD